MKIEELSKEKLIKKVREMHGLLAEISIACHIPWMDLPEGLKLKIKKTLKENREG